MTTPRDTSKDGFENKLQTFVLTNFKPIWQFIQSNKSLKHKVNKTLINSLIYKIPTRPNPYSMMSLAYS
jgi:prostaglandin-endoperoxide synthase 2